MSRTCPQCKKSARPKAENEAFPFCGKRCQNIDLSRWFGAEYVVSRPLFDPGLFGLPTDNDED